MRPRTSRLALVAAAGLIPLAISGTALAAGPSHQVFKGKPSSLSAAQVSQLSADAVHRSIIVFKNTLAATPATRAGTQQRIQAANAAQAGVKAELTRLHAGHMISFHIIDAMAATISSPEIKRLQANPAVSAVVPDAVRHFAPLGSGPGAATPSGLTAQQHGAAATAAAAQQICPASPSKPLIEPEARTVMNVAAAEKIATGKGVKVGIIADGIDPDNPDLIRPDGQHVIFDYRDFSGFGPTAPTDGREAFLDAGTIASQGNQTYDLSGFVNPAHPLPAGCNIKIKGIAPGASLAVLNVAGSAAGFFNSQIIQAVQWAVLHDHVNVLNESIGANPIPNTQNDPVALADQAAVAAGVTVVASSGDAGPFNNIGSPATTPGVIGVGGTTTYQVYRQTTRYGTQLVPGGWENNNITALSSDGITEFNPHTVDVVAPGDRGWSLCSANTTEFFGCADIDHGTNPPPIWAAGGTSASAPETSGTAALVIQAYSDGHHGSLPSPALVQRIIVSTATDLHAPADHQGAGLVNTLKAVQLAKSIGGSPVGKTLLLSKPQLSATVNAGQTASYSIGVTNEGTGTQKVTPTVSGRPTPITDTTGSVSLSASSPTYIDGEGNTDHYAETTFNVPAGADNLNGNITWNDLTIGGVAYETLFDPSHRVAAYSLIGTDQSGFGHVEVHNPEPGKWTAVIFTNSTAPYYGPVKFSYQTQKYHQVGSVSPSSLTLAPGQSGTVHVSVTAGQAGDEAFSLHLDTGSSTDGSVPIVLRALVTGRSLRGTLTGGGSTGNAGQEFTYQLAVPRGRASLNLGVKLRDSDYNLNGFLIDPNGEPVDAQSTAQISPSGTLTGFGPDMQFFRRTPAPGLWTLVLNVAGPGDGAHLSEPFTGAVSYAAPSVTGSGIPDSAATVLPAGKPVTATIKITNTGNAQKYFFADARLDGLKLQALLGSDTSDVPLPLSLSAQPNWLVPTNTRLLGVAAKGTVPITMDVSWDFGDPDVLGVSSGKTSVAALAAPEVAPGFFFALPDATGPFTGPVSGTVNLGAEALTNPFDSAVSASSGDIWAQSVNASAPYTPLSLAPGQSGTITLTITPNAAKGTVVHGFVGVDTFTQATDSGDELINIPYTYKVG